MTESASFKKDVNLQTWLKFCALSLFVCLKILQPSLCRSLGRTKEPDWSHPNLSLTRPCCVFFFLSIKLRFLIQIYLKEQLPQVRNVWKPLVSKKRKDSQTCCSNNIHAIVIRSEHCTLKNIFNGELSQLILRKPKPHYIRGHWSWIPQPFTGFWLAHGALLIQEKKGHTVSWLTKLTLQRTS